MPQAANNFAIRKLEARSKEQGARMGLWREYGTAPLLFIWYVNGDSTQRQGREFFQHYSELLSIS